MKQNSFENLDKFFERVKSVGFFERLFAWKNVVSLSYDAYGEFKSVDKKIIGINEELDEIKSQLKDAKKDLQNQQESNKKLEIKLGALENENKNISKELTEFKTAEKQREQAYQHKVTELNSLKGQLDDDRVRIQQEREEEIKKNFEEMKETWQNHETKVEQTIKSICDKNQIEYFDKEKVPFKGKPDNTIKICDEYIIFDAKSPQSDDLTNFSSYIKIQTESVKKYIKEKDIKKDIFLVIPSNTVGIVGKFYYNMADYNVYIVTLDSLEPIILSLKKIEDYEFAEQLSPEDRENICRVIGKFAHATKRRIQVDGYFASEFINILSNCNNIPEDILSKSIQFEKSDKMNPPIEKRAKEIQLHEIKKETKRLKQEAEAKEIDTEADLRLIEKIPLYKEEK